MTQTIISARTTVCRLIIFAESTEHGERKKNEGRRTKKETKEYKNDAENNKQKKKMRDSKGL